MSTFIFALFFIGIIILCAKILFWGLKETWNTQGLGKDAFYTTDK